MPTEPVDQAAAIITETDLIQAEMVAMLDGLNGARPTKAMMRRVAVLRARIEALGVTAGRLLCREMAIEVALRQRLLRQDVEGELILPADEYVADRMLAGLGIGVGDTT